MRAFAALLLLLLACAPPAMAGSIPAPIAQVPLLPQPPQTDEAVDALIRAHWQPYFNTGADSGFSRSNILVGRLDLNGQNRPALFVMIDHNDWEDENGRPFAIADWNGKGWIAVGFGRGDPDTVFATTEIVGGWRSIDTGTQLLRWNGRQYVATPRPAD